MKIVEFIILVVFLLLSECYAQISFEFTLEKQTKLSHGFEATVIQDRMGRYFLNIKCVKCDRTKPLPNFVALKVDYRTYTSDKCTKVFCPRIVLPPSPREFRLVSWQDWDSGLDFNIGLTTGTYISLKISSMPVIGRGAWPAFLATKRSVHPRTVKFVHKEEVLYAKTYNMETDTQIVSVESYDLWVVMVAKYALEKNEIVMFPNVDYHEGLKTLFYFAGDYNLIAIQKIILAQVFSILTLENFSDILAFVWSLKQDRYGFVQKSVDFLGAYYCDKMWDLELSSLLEEADFKLSCQNTREIARF